MASEEKSRRRVAVVLFNLGGPDGPEAVRPFLFNLFNDKAIIAAPGPIRWMIAQLISRTREKSAQENYAHMGGKSPLLDWTEKQATALKDALQAEDPDTQFETFIGMRYWKPFVGDAAKAVQDWSPDHVVLAPLYPQFSTTTTGSSLSAWAAAEKAVGLSVQTHAICCYPREPQFLDSHVSRIRDALSQAPKGSTPRILFSAHGLPEKIVAGGDPYQWQIEETVRGVVEKLNAVALDTDFESVVCYQSRVGPAEMDRPEHRR